ncbi:MAG: hypothetical protein JXQ82_02555 [Methanomicrobiaceae archaeon]|nr:hypothetical protein [Methanomicrobiaceae archaeon]
MAEITVFTKDCEKIVLTGPLKNGGEGAIYSVKKNPFICAKIYNKDKITPKLCEKIEAMIKNPPGENLTGHKKSMRSSSISWPLSSLYDSNKKEANFLGFTMPLVDTSLFKEAHRYYDQQDREKEMGGSFSWLYLLTTAFNISYVVSAIHKKGHRIGDMSSTNILVARTAAISIIDCDSFQIEDNQKKKLYYTKVATGDFLPPELMGKNFREEDIDRYYSDLFALGIIIFKFLMNGYHPYQARGEGVMSLPAIEQKIIKGFYSYEGVYADVMPPKNAPPYSIISPELRKLFHRCFVDGHKSKNLRPSASEWAEALREELSGIRHCTINENHWYSGSLKKCPWCTLKETQKSKKDIFPPNPDNKNNQTEIRAIKSSFRPAKIFTPIPFVTQKKVDLRLLQKDIVFFELDIENRGDGVLTGKLSSDRDWIFIQKPDFSTADKTQIQILIDKKKLPHIHTGIKLAGIITVLTNGGKIKVPVTVAAGKAPLLNVLDEKIILKKIKKGQLQKINLDIINKGDGFLSGTISSNRDWIRVIPEKISTASKQTVEILIDTKKAEENIFLFGKLEIFTNGGSLSIPVALTLQD